MVAVLATPHGSTRHFVALENANACAAHGETQSAVCTAPTISRILVLTASCPQCWYDGTGLPFPVLHLTVFDGMRHCKPISRCRFSRRGFHVFIWFCSLWERGLYSPNNMRAVLRRSGKPSVLSSCEREDTARGRTIFFEGCSPKRHWRTLCSSPEVDEIEGEANGSPKTRRRGRH